MIIVDMIGYAHLDIQRETYSTRWLTDLVFTQARRLGYGRYFLNNRRGVEDDQLAFLRLGIPAVDVIDLDYGPLNLYWHTRSDTVREVQRGQSCDRRGYSSKDLGSTRRQSVFAVMRLKCAALTSGKENSSSRNLPLAAVAEELLESPLPESSGCDA